MRALAPAVDNSVLLHNLENSCRADGTCFGLVAK